MLNLLRNFLKKDEIKDDNNATHEKTNLNELEEYIKKKEKEKEKEMTIAGLTVDAWSELEVNLGTLNEIETKLETYDETVGIVKACVEDEVILVESATSVEGAGIRETILSVVKEEIENTEGISDKDVEISVIEIGTTDEAGKACEILEEVLIEKYDL